MSDSNYAAVTRFRRPYSTNPPVFLDDPSWRSEKLQDDEVDVQQFEAALAPLLEEGELDADAIVVTPAGNSSAAANHAAERRRREERWNDIGLDQLLQPNEINNPTNQNNATSSTNETHNQSRNETSGTGA